MGFYTNIYDGAKAKAVEDVKFYAKILLEDAECFEENEEENSDFVSTLLVVEEWLKSTADKFSVAIAKDVATDLLIDDADFPQMYTQHLIDKDRSILEEVVDRVWKSGKVDDCTYTQTERGVEEAWTELEQTSFEGCDEIEEA